MPGVDGPIAICHDEFLFRYVDGLPAPRTVAIRRREELGNVLQYTVYRPGLHTSEDERWHYRVVIVYRNQLVPAQARERRIAIEQDTDCNRRPRWIPTLLHARRH
jgi:hypothetical protein